ncbi:MAG: enoyl-CoA hydratase/isomerase family protein [Chloroflexi bacterium]|nr:enoyl-CoA hydratase/isomerase family protein [Chloroflexota bacterium]
MSYETIILDKKPVATITLNRPEVRNALNAQLMKELYDALGEVERDNGIRVVILRGAGGKAFCAGADLGEVTNKSALDYREHFAVLPEIFLRMAHLGKPIIAAVQGYALAGGCGLAAACDLGIATDDSRFGLTEIKVGLYPMVVSAPISRLIGRKRALEIFFTGQMFDASEAARIGLINRAVPGDQFEDAVMGLADTLAGLSPAILRLGKDAFYTMADMEYSQALRYLKEMVVMVSVSEDSREGIAAFLEKRPPQWKGR